MRKAETRTPYEEEDVGDFYVANSRTKEKKMEDDRWSSTREWKLATREVLAKGLILIVRYFGLSMSTTKQVHM